MILSRADMDQQDKGQEGLEWRIRDCPGVHPHLVKHDKKIVEVCSMT